MNVKRGSRSRFTAFCDLIFVSSQITPSTMPYHMATRCGRPSAPMVARVPVRLLVTKSVISSSDITICERCLVPMQWSVSVASAQ